MRGIFSAASGDGHRSTREVKQAQQDRRREDIPADRKQIRQVIKARRSI